MKSPTLSIILTIYNKEFLIKRVLDSIIKNKSLNTKELIIVFDGCADKSELYTKESLYNIRDISIIYEYADNVYETKSNNIGLKHSSCNYSMIIQDDMIIEEKDFDNRMLKPFIFSDTFAVGSRLAHNDYCDHNHFWWGDFMGFDPYNRRILPARRDFYYIRDICNRGPLVVDNEKIQKLNYFDEIFWPQNMDDHDICFRAWKNYNWVSGSFWIKWNSKEEWGGMRQDKKKYIWFEKCNENNKKILMERYFDLLQSNAKHNQARLII